MRTGSGQSDRKEVQTTITDARIAAAIDGPPKAGLNAAVPLTIKVTNTGSGPLNGVKLVVTLDGRPRRDAQGNTSLNQTIAQPIGPGQTFSDTLTVFARQKGRGQATLVAVTGSISANAAYAVEVQEPTVSLNIDGPPKKYVGRNADYTISVRNPTDQPLNNVFVRDTLPPELEFVTAGDGQFNGKDVVWNLGTLGPGQSRDIKLTARCKDKTPVATQTISVTDNAASLASRQHGTEIFGAAGIKLEMRDLHDPVPMNDRAEYEIVLTNSGTAETAKNMSIGGEITQAVDKATGQVFGGLLRIEQGAGPTQIDIIENGKRCTFRPFDLAPQERKVFRVIVLTGNREMDGVFSASRSRGPLQTPVIEDREHRNVGGVGQRGRRSAAPPVALTSGGGCGPAGGPY